MGKHVRKKRIILMLIFSIVSHFSTIIAQNSSSNINWLIEYSPNLSKITNEIIKADYKFGQNAAIKMSFKLKEGISSTVGLFYLNTGEKIISNLGTWGIDKFSQTDHHNYIGLVGGLLFESERLFVSPEIGIGYNFINRISYKTYYENGEVRRESSKLTSLFGNYNSLTFPLSLKIGYKILIKEKTLFIGIKGYYGLNRILDTVPRDNHYKGLGLLFAYRL